MKKNPRGIDLMSGSPFSSLRVRLIILILIAVVPAVGLMVYSAAEQERLDAAAARKELSRLATIYAREEHQLLEGTRQVLKTLGEFLAWHHNDPPACSAFFADLLRDFRRYANFGAVKANGEVFCSAVPLAEPTSADDRQWFQQVMQTGQFTVSGFQVGRITGKPVLLMAYPWTAPGQSTSGAVFAAIDLEWLDWFAFPWDEQLPPGATLARTDDQGVVLSQQSGPDAWVGQPVPVPDLLAAVLARKRGLLEAFNPEGARCLYAYEPILSGFSAREGYLILAVPKRIAFAASRRALTRNLLWLGIASMVALLAAWFGGDLFLLRQVRTLLATTRRLATGDLSARTGARYGHGELGELERAFDEMAAALQEKEGERLLAHEELRTSQMELRNLSLYLQTAREEERTRIAREIHDELGQTLTALKMDLSWLKKRLGPEQDSLDAKTATMERLIDATIQTVQRLSGELRPGLLDDLGLAAAMEWQAGEFEKRSGIPCRVQVSPEEITLDRDRSTAVFRIFQEALTNVARHAGATEVAVSLKQREARVNLTVVDNGRGITEKEISSSKSFGLLGIRERVLFLGGDVVIEGRPKKGTTVRVAIPLDPRE
jgi:signal transduction histidine kinase